MTQTQSFRSLILIPTVLALAATCLACSDYESLDPAEEIVDASDHTLVTDLDSGSSIEIQHTRTGSLITDLETGESIEVEGDFRDMSDEEYTDMMAYKRMGEAGPPLGGELDLNSHSRSGNSLFGFSVTGGTGGFDTPNVYINTSNLDVEITQSYNVQNLAVTLYQYRSFWLNKNLGTKHYTSAGPVSKRWSVVAGKKHFANVTRSPSAVATSGTIAFDW